jgi:hypothetical protein
VRVAGRRNIWRIDCERSRGEARFPFLQGAWKATRLAVYAGPMKSVARSASGGKKEVYCAIRQGWAVRGGTPGIDTFLNARPRNRPGRKATGKRMCVFPFACRICHVPCRTARVVAHA